MVETRHESERRIDIHLPAIAASTRVNSRAMDSIRAVIKDVARERPGHADTRPRMALTAPMRR